MVCMNGKLKHCWPVVGCFHPWDLPLKIPTANLFLFQPLPQSGPNSLGSLHLGKKKIQIFSFYVGFPLRPLDEK